VVRRHGSRHHVAGAACRDEDDPAVGGAGDGGAAMGESVDVKIAKQVHVVSVPRGA
jgi:hypothetical protein